MDIRIFSADMQPALTRFFIECFAAVGIPYSPADRHADIVDVETNYMKTGCFWCLTDGDDIIGTVAIRSLSDAEGIVELKRMFVLPAYQGNGFGRRLLEHAIDYSRKRGYRKICLDTRKQFSAAQHLYLSAGFTEIAKYNNNEHAELYFELDL